MTEPLDVFRQALADSIAALNRLKRALRMMLLTAQRQVGEPGC